VLIVTFYLHIRSWLILVAPMHVSILSFCFLSVKKDTAAEIAKKREQERQRQEKLAEVGRYKRRSRSRSLSRSPPR
jgi:outer membrane biogenesis lipoprotein LolB